MTHPDAQRLAAFHDGELDANVVRELELHLAKCAQCRQELDSLRALGKAMRAAAPQHRAPAALRQRLQVALDQLAPPRSQRRPTYWWGVLTGGVGTAATAALALLVWLQVPTGGLPDQLVTAHVRAAHAGSPIDVLSTDRHTVKPWFASHADVSPIVVDLAAAGYPLIGGRADPLGAQRAAVVVYRHGAHLVSVTSWLAGTRSMPETASRRGYHVACWRAADLASCAVSDTGWDELLTLQRLLQAESSREVRE
jgi:anti-sigma factor RsiW